MIVSGCNRCSLPGSTYVTYKVRLQKVQPDQRGTQPYNFFEYASIGQYCSPTWTHNAEGEWRVNTSSTTENEGQISRVSAHGVLDMLFGDI